MKPAQREPGHWRIAYLYPGAEGWVDIPGAVSHLLRREAPSPGQSTWVEWLHYDLEDPALQAPAARKALLRLAEEASVDLWIMFPPELLSDLDSVHESAHTVLLQYCLNNQIQHLAREMHPFGDLSFLFH